MPLMLLMLISRLRTKKKSNILDIDYDKIRKNNPVALDGHHPGEQAHRLLAQELYRYTTKNEGNR